MTNVLGFEEIDRTQVAVVGGKGASLGELSRLEGIRVPPGFCVTTDACARIAAGAIPGDVKSDIARWVERLGASDAYAVRSSATAEDAATTSFAGQHDSYLNVVGLDAILAHVQRCCASLFTERAVAYRERNGIGEARMAVVVQRMVAARAAGVMFTADPLSGNRTIATVEAVAGLGEALVAGHVNADRYQVRGDAVLSRTVGGEPVLGDAEVTALVKLGRRIEAHHGAPQDIEWCVSNDGIDIVQSRPITTLFPVPPDDGENHVYLSVGHQQMMTDAFKPLGLSIWQLTTLRPMAEAGSRLFVDVTRVLATPRGRASLLESFRKSDPLVPDALQALLDRGDFVPSLPDADPGWAPPADGAPPVEPDPAIPAALVAETTASIADAERGIHDLSGTALLDFIASDLAELKTAAFKPRGLQIIMAAMNAIWWLNENIHAWLGEGNVADTLSQSVPDNVTSEMGLALLDVADAIRSHPAVITFLERTDRDDFLDVLPTVAGGAEARAAIEAWLERYGMRGTGEIDITRPRWSERPTVLLPILLANVRTFEHGAGARRFEQGRSEAERKAAEILARLRALPDGEAKAAEAKRNIELVRAFAGYREYPKYAMITRYFIYKRALLREADRLVKEGILREREEIFYLRFEELHDVIRSGHVDRALLRQREDAYRAHTALRPPRVLTSAGEALNGAYRRGDVPAGALVGSAVSTGTVEGRARVVVDLAMAEIEPGDILVTTFTDPSWTPLFVAIRGLVTEVGGLMTHGAVIAREYGLPAIVGVENATRLIRDGQRIRIHGTEGYVELLP